MQSPAEYEDAARVDGAGELAVLTRVVMPLAWPGILTAGLVVGLWAWNEFLIAVTFIETPSRLPASLSFYTFQQGYGRNYTLISAAGVTLAVPMLLLFLVMQRRFIAGLSSSGLKGLRDARRFQTHGTRRGLGQPRRPAQGGPAARSW